LYLLQKPVIWIDYETDRVMQDSLRTQLGKDVTLLAVAHRLRTRTVVCPFASPRASPPNFHLNSA
ncbi:hypothetical protein B0H11DRAFT_1717465, partial [Mycena galericulata]